MNPGTVIASFATLLLSSLATLLAADQPTKPREQHLNKPLVNERIVFNWHNFLSGCSTWNLGDWNRWTDDAQKLGYNAIMVHAYGNNPMVCFPFRGITKPVGYLSTTVKGRDWSTMHVNDVRRLWGGEVFDGPVFGADAGMVPDDQRVAAVQALMRDVFAHAAMRGMGVVFAVDVDRASENPPELVGLLPESARFKAGGIWYPNPDTPEGYEFFQAEVAGLMKTYPQITRLEVWFRRGGSPLMDLKVVDMPPAWQNEWAGEIARAPAAEKEWKATGLFAIGKILRACDRALKECGAEQTRLAAGTWGFEFLSAADRFFPKEVALTGLDYDVLHEKPQLATAESRAPLREIGARRPLIPIIWAHHDDGHYIGRPYTPFSDFHSKLADVNASGFGIIHWTTRPLDLFFASHARQVFEATKNEPLRATCDQVGGKALGQYLYRWITEAPRFGRETGDLFIDRPLTNIAEVVSGCAERLKLLEKIDAAALTPAQRAQIEYIKGLEQFIAAFFQAHGKFQEAQAALNKRDLAAARTAVAECKAETVIEQFARFSSIGGITRGEQGLVVSLNTRWLPPIVRLRQQVGAEAVRYNFGPTSHDPLAQLPGRFTFFFDAGHGLWQTLGKQETGAEKYLVPEASDEICRSGIESDKPIVLILGPIFERSRNPAPLPAGDYRLRLLMLDPKSTAPGQRVFSIAVSIAGQRMTPLRPAGRAAPSTTLAERVDIFAETGERQRVLERAFNVKLSKPGCVELTLKPLKGKALICGVVLEPVSRWVTIDNFQSYPPDVLPKTAAGWTLAHPDVSRAAISTDRLAPANQALKLQRIAEIRSDQHDTLFHTGAVNIPPGSKGTVFLRFLIESGLDPALGSTTGDKHQNVSLKIGLTEAALNAGNCRAGIWVNGGSAYALPNKPEKDLLVSVRRNRWYRLWLVVDNDEGATDHSAAYLQEEGATGSPMRIPGSILVPTENGRGILATVGVVKSRDAGLTDIWLDDVFVDNSGENLTDPTTSVGAIGWKQKLENEAKPYRHLLSKAPTPQQAEQQARQLLAAMTREEKFALVCGDGAVGIPGFPRLGIPPVFFSDASAGINNGPAPVKNRHPQSVAYPCLLLLAATWDPQMAEDYARAIGEECRSGGTHVLLAPSVNFYRVSVCGRNFEYPGEDPHLAGRMTADYVRGLQSTGTAATLKVLIGNEIEFHRRGSNSIIDERTLNEVYLEPFRTGISAGAMAVMTAYNQLNGAWCGQDKYVGTTILRDQLGFRGISMTDWIGTYDGVKVAESGTDLEMPGGWALKKDRAKVIGSADIDRMVLNVLKTCIYAGFYEPGYPQPELLKRRPQWEETALRVNQDGIVLLQNNGILPLSASQVDKTILLSGNNAKREELAGGGSGHVKGYHNKTYVQAVTETFGDAKVVHVEKPTGEQIRAADLVLLFPGFPLTGKGHEGEGSDRDFSFALPDDQLVANCVALNPKTIVCVTAGGGVQMDWADKAAAIVHCLYGGQTGAAALLDILTGKVNPSGKLPFTIERKLEDSPAHDVSALMPNTARPYSAADFPGHVKGNFFSSDDNTQFYVCDVNYREGVFVGHRWYDSKNLPVRFPFGHGLSYTTFAMSDLNLASANGGTRVSCVVKNTGSKAGAEVIQVYVAPTRSSVPRPPQELKAFQKVRLQPGEIQCAEIQLSPEAFRFWHPEKKAWVTEPGQYEIRVGTSSRDIRLCGTVTL